MEVTRAVREYTHLTVEFDMDFHLGRSEELLNVLLELSALSRDRRFSLKQERRLEDA